MSRYLLTPDQTPTGTPVFRSFPDATGIVTGWTDDLPSVDGIPVDPAAWAHLACDNCGAEVLETYACPNDTRTCVDCCPCHREDDATPVPPNGSGSCAHGVTVVTVLDGVVTDHECPACATAAADTVSPTEMYVCDDCEAQVMSPAYLTDCGTCGRVDTVVAYGPRFRVAEVSALTIVLTPAHLAYLASLTDADDDPETAETFGLTDGVWSSARAVIRDAAHAHAAASQPPVHPSAR